MTELVITRGDTRQLRFVVTDAAGTSVDLDGFDVTFSAKQRALDETVLISKTLGAGITQGVVGELLVAINPADTWPFASGTALVWDLQIIDTGGNVRTPVQGRLIIVPDVTRSNET